MATTNLPISRKHGVIAAPCSEELKQVFPWARQVQDLLLINHGNDEVRLLRNLGYNADAPILTQYDWLKDTPFETQKKTAAMLTTYTRAYVLSTMGCGKTRATLHAANFLMDRKEIRKVLVVAPLSTLSLVWEKEIFSYFFHRSALILHGTKATRLDRLGLDADIYIINHDGILTILPELIAKKEIDLVIIDELASFRNHGTGRWKGLKKLIEGRKYVWGLTGAPTPNAPTDAWAQCKLLTPERVDPYYGQFRNKTMRQITQFKWAPKHEAVEIVNTAMRPSVRFTREECVELPPGKYVTREVDLSDRQKRVYDLMLKKLKAEQDEHRITAANEGVKLGKLLQICCGWVYSDVKGVVDLAPKNRLEEVKANIEQSTGKVIVFVPYIHSVNGVFSYLSKHFSCAKVYGDTNKKDRDFIFTQFQNADNPRVLVAHPRTMAHGLTLTAASTIIWFSPPQSLELYLQANARITRPGQKNKQLVIGIVGSKVERLTYARLANNDKLQGVLLDTLSGLNET